MAFNYLPVTTPSAVRRRTTAAPTAIAAAATEGEDWSSTRDTKNNIYSGFPNVSHVFEVFFWMKRLYTHNVHILFLVR